MATNAGLIVSNAANQLVIDSEFRNPALRQKGTTATTTIKGGGSFVSFTVSGITSTPIIAVSSSAGAVAHINTVSASGVATVEIVCYGPVGTNVTWYIFDDPGVAADLHYMAVWDANAKPVFNANERYMKVVATLGVPAVTAASVTLTAGRTYATYLVAPAARSVSFNSGTPNDSNWYITSIRRFLRVNGAVVDTVEQDVGQTGPYIQSTAPQRYQIDSTAFILDVTNY